MNRLVYGAHPGARDHRRGIDRLARGVAARSTTAASASASSGTWAGCTTRWHYMAREPVHRKYHHNELTFGLLYAFSENFVLPLSHDEVVHGKGSIDRQDARRRLAEVRQPARLLRLHVGASRQEAAVHGPGIRPGRANGSDQRRSTGSCSTSRSTAACRRWCATSTASTATRRALHARDCEGEGFEWIVADDARAVGLRLAAQGAEGATRRSRSSRNFTPVPRHGYRVGLPAAGRWREVAQHRRRPSMAARAWAIWAGSTRRTSRRTAPASARLTLPPLATICLASIRMAA